MQIAVPPGFFWDEKSMARPLRAPRSVCQFSQTDVLLERGTAMHRASTKTMNGLPQHAAAQKFLRTGLPLLAAFATLGYSLFHM